MPIYEYEAKDPERGCALCAHPFDRFHQAGDRPLTVCPQCGGSVVKLISAPSVGSSKSGLDDRAKSAGFTKLKRLGKGEYEKQY
jgi:putative FmdB family regulatory protein